VADSSDQTGSGRTVFILAVLILLILGWLACTLVKSPLGVPPTVKIGLVAPFEGLHRPLGYEALFGVKLAIQERNQGQGLHGYRIELVALNDFDDPAEARKQAAALVADLDILGVVGHLSSSTTLAAGPVYQQANLAMSIPWPVLAFPQRFEENGMVSMAATQAETSAVLTKVGRLRGIDQMARVTGPTVNALPNTAQAIELATDGVLAGEILLALEASDLLIPVYGQVDVGSPQVIQVAQAAANGLIYVSPAPAPRDVEATAFIEAYQNLAGFPPGPRAVLAYDATHVLLDSIEQAIIKYNRRPGRSEVSALINRVERAGISGSIVFDEQGQRIEAPVWVYQISNQEYPGILLAP
jgi:ABC-type branched-subunit amino acid transport system substrate-binding protein